MDQHIGVALCIPGPWPPGSQREIGEWPVGGVGNIVTLFAESSGRLRVRVRLAGVQDLEAHSLRLAIAGPNKTTFICEWTDNSVKIHINGVDVTDITQHSNRVVDIPLSPDVARREGPTRIFLTLDPAASSTPDEEFFIRTLEDVDRKAISGEPYELVRAAGLLRQLLLDGQPLVHVVNRAHRLRLEFETLPFRPPEQLGARIVWRNIDRSSLTSANTRAHSLDQLLAVPCFYQADGVTGTVGDVIRACAHVHGGVHRGRPRNDVERAIVELDNAGAVGPEGPPGIAAVRGICRVVLTGLVPLALAIEAAAQPEAAD